MIKYVEIENERGLVRDINSHAIINTNYKDYKKFKEKQKEKNKLHELEIKFLDLEKKLDKIINFLE